MTETLDSIYNYHILDLAGNLRRRGRLDDPDGSAEANSKLCGSKIIVDVKIDDEGRISDFAHDVKACALGQASAGIMARHVIGSDLNELQQLRQAMLAMLKGNDTTSNGKWPGDKWSELKYLEPVKNFKARHASTMLTFDATIAALIKALAARGITSTRESEMLIQIKVSYIKFHAENHRHSFNQTIPP